MAVVTARRSHIIEQVTSRRKVGRGWHRCRGAVCRDDAFSISRAAGEHAHCGQLFALLSDCTVQRRLRGLREAIARTENTRRSGGLREPSTWPCEAPGMGGSSRCSPTRVWYHFRRSAGTSGCVSARGNEPGSVTKTLQPKSTKVEVKNNAVRGMTCDGLPW